MKKTRVKIISPKTNKVTKTKIRNNPKKVKKNKKCNCCLMTIFGIYYFFKILSNPNRVKLDIQLRKRIVDDVKRKYKQGRYKSCIEPFEECLKYSNLFQTKIPEMYGLEPIENNIAEGVVIKPVKDLRFGNGQRVILKK